MAATRTLFLHIGMHKTGTSSIQRTLHAQPEELARFGYAYFPMEANHSRAIASISSDEPELHHGNRFAGRHRRQDAIDYAQNARQALSDFLANAPATRLVISGEGIAMLTDGEMDRLMAFLRPQVDRIVVVGLVRDPRSYVISAMQQAIRAGRTLAELEGEAMRRPAYRKRFQRFANRPEVDEMRLRRYHPQSLLHECSVATFLQMCDAPAALYATLKVLRENSAISDVAARLLLAANEVAPVFLPDGQRNPERSPKLRRVIEAIPGPRFSPPQDLVDRMVAAAVDDTAWIEEQLGERLTETGTGTGAGTMTAATDETPSTLRRFDWQDGCAIITLLNARLGAPADERARRPRRPGAAGRKRL